MDFPDTVTGLSKVVLYLADNQTEVRKSSQSQ